VHRFTMAEIARVCPLIINWIWPSISPSRKRTAAELGTSVFTMPTIDRIRSICFIEWTEQTSELNFIS